jgi:hypothetical protein
LVSLLQPALGAGAYAGPQEFDAPLSSLLLQTVFVMQSTEKWLRRDAVAGWKLVATSRSTLVAENLLAKAGHLAAWHAKDTYLGSFYWRIASKTRI